MSLKAFVWSDIGKKRQKNEDSFLFSPDLGLYVVADGMGGHVGGKQASSLAVEEIESFVKQNRKTKKKTQLLQDAVRAATRKVFEESHRHPELNGMGTTVTALLIDEQEAVIANVGDSRTYLMRESKIRQVSEDHSLVQEQFRAGILSAEEAQHSQYRNIITRSIGFEKDVQVDIFTEKCQEKDMFLLCSDGLTTLVEDAEIAKVLEKRSQKTAGKKLIELANSRGGYDNITVILVYV